MEQMFFDGWATLFRTAITGLLAYTSLILFLRIFGKRILSKMNAFDLVVTVSLGSTLATVMLNQEVSLAQGALAFALLIGMQFAVTWTSVRISWVRKVVTGEPSLLYYQSAYLPNALRRTRVTEDEIRAAVRANGLAGFDQVEAVVLETDGSFSVVQRSATTVASSLKGVNFSKSTEEA